MSLKGRHCFGIILVLGMWASAADPGAADATAGLQNEHLRVEVGAQPFKLRILDRSRASPA